MTREKEESEGGGERARQGRARERRGEVMEGEGDRPMRHHPFSTLAEEQQSI